MHHPQLVVHSFHLNAILQPFFSKRNWTPFDFQLEAWNAYQEGKSGLIHAPTGLGKTLAAYLGPVANAVNQTPPPGQLRVLWLTPLRALANDTVESLREPLTDLAPQLTVESRTGDTSGYRKKRIREKPPFTLVTTPESLSLLLTYEDSRSYFANLQCIVIDEWHELIGTKRGVQTELGLARLRRYASALRTWALSATLGNLEEAARVLTPTDTSVGMPPRGIREAQDRQSEHSPPANSSPTLIHSHEQKSLRITTLLPRSIERFPWAGHIGTRLARQVAKQIDAHNSTLLFTNTRSQTEIWFQELTALRPEWADTLAMHHGSLEREERTRVEQGLAAGSLKCVVCTSSLDLGVDFSPVDLVIQVGSPKGIARLLQRAGRSGHAPGQTSRLICVPTNALELLEFAAARDAIQATGRDASPRRPQRPEAPRIENTNGPTSHPDYQIESRQPLSKPLDLLVQHLVTLLISEPSDPEDLLAEIRTTHAYQKLTDEEWQWALGFITHGGNALKAYPGYRKAEEQADGKLAVTDPRKIQLHRMSIGTITSDQNITVKMSNGKVLGTVEEGFVSRFKPGQQFIFAGRRLELVRLRASVAQVKAATKKNKGNIATWTGAKMSLSSELIHSIAHRLHQPADDQPETKLLLPLLETQSKTSRLPEDTSLLIELTTIEAETVRQPSTSKSAPRASADPFQHHAFVFTLAGRLANEGLGALAASRLTNNAGQTVQATQNDYGFSLSSPDPLPTDEAAWRALFTTENLVDDLLAALNATELARRQFRDIARIAGLVVENFPGKRKTSRELQTSASLLYDVFSNYDPDNLLLEQARREILEKQLELTRLQSVLITLSDLPIHLIQTKRLTPFAFPLWADRLQANTTATDFASRLARMLEHLEG
ncbi:MAG: DEAD/DEAH box helicase [Verrucomicrobiota bacterium JB023]|nr:DEAD/DEAH box helicase [Verrucomicrobiota bacterium JB023]